MLAKQKNRRSGLLAIVCLMFSFILLFLASAAISEVTKPNPIDVSFFRFCESFTNPLSIQIAIFISFFGTAVFLVPAYILIVYFLVKLNHERYAAMVTTIIITSLLSGWLLKLIFHKHRPPVPLVPGAGWYSFPSGHALGAFTFSGICLFLLWKARISNPRKRVFSGIFIVFGCLIGLSRIFLHVHYATDVFGSLFFSGFWILFVYMIFRIMYGMDLHKKKERVPSLHRIQHSDR